MNLIKNEGHFNQLNGLRNGQCGNQKKDLEFKISQVKSSLYPEFEKLWLVELWGDFRIKAFNVSNSLGEQSSHYCYFKTLDKANEYFTKIRKELGMESGILKFRNIVNSHIEKDITLYKYSILDSVENLRKIQEEYQELLSIISDIQALNGFINDYEGIIPNVPILIEDINHIGSNVRIRRENEAISIKINLQKFNIKDNIDSLKSRLSKDIDSIDSIIKAIEE